jgi:hypothetical protein
LINILFGHARRRRLKLLGRLRVFEAKDRPDLANRLAIPGYGREASAS